jgi:hypothetical protein
MHGVGPLSLGMSKLLFWRVNDLKNELVDVMSGFSWLGERRMYDLIIGLVRKGAGRSIVSIIQLY